MMKLPYTVERMNAAVVNVTLDIGKQAGFKEQWFLLQSDDHWDNPKCRRDLLKHHCDQALERGAGIIKVGDLFCAMQGKYDKRSSKDDVRPEHQNGRYLDSLVDTGAEWFAPYAHNIIAVGKGNHETGILKHHETDLIERFCATTNNATGAKIESMGYGFWVRFNLKRGRQQQSVRMKCFHGSGGGGPVTKGVIQTNRRAVFLPDADIVVSGHVHEAWALQLRRERITTMGKIYHDSQWHVTTPTYKEEYGDGHGGWHIERGAAPKPLGAYWMRVFYYRDRFDYELIPATENYTAIAS